MELNLEELKDWKDGARRLLDREIERLQEKAEQLQDYSRWMDATDKLIAENERLRDEQLTLRAEIDLLKRTTLDGLLKVIHVSGDYNDVHENTQVNI